jgi:anti-sigma factor RsiW
VSSAAPDEMTCRELVEVITNYIEGTLPEHDRRRFEQHLGECPGCVNYLEQMRATIDALGELREESIPPAAREELLEALRRWRAAR